MADKNDHGDSGQSDFGLWVVIGVAILALVLFGSSKTVFDPRYINLEYFFNKISDGVNPFLETITNGHTWYMVGVVSSLISIFCIGIIIFSLVRMREIQNHEKEEIDHYISLALARDREVESKQNPRWRYVLGLVESPSESDWRIAIIECDAILDELLENMGYTGETVAEKLKNAQNSQSFLTIDNAWEGHNIRNRIAHEGYDFPLSQLETRRIIRLFETVFEELRYI